MAVCATVRRARRLCNFRYMYIVQAYRFLPLNTKSRCGFQSKASDLLLHRIRFGPAVSPFALFFFFVFLRFQLFSSIEYSLNISIDIIKSVNKKNSRRPKVEIHSFFRRSCILILYLPIGLCYRHCVDRCFRFFFNLIK